MSHSSSFIVAIDTSSRRASVAVSAEGRLVALFGLESDAPQSAELWGNVDMLLGGARRSVRHVTAVAVTIGPGSFTGLRVGMAAAAGLARALDRPLFGATTLELTARAGGAAEDVWAVINAHRGEVYAQRFTVSPEGVASPQCDPLVARPDAVFGSFAEGPLRVVGDGATVFGESLERAAASRGIAVCRPAVAAPVASGWQIAPTPSFLAGDLAALAARWEAEGLEPGTVEPCYVRPSEAEINLRAGRLGPNGPGRGRR